MKLTGIIKTYEMSGMGRGYEDGVQKMVWAAMKWLEGKPTDILDKTKIIKNVYGICDTPDSVEEMRQIMLKTNDGCSGAQYQCAIGHAGYIHKNGYKQWFEQLKKVRTADKEQEFNLDKMELLPLLTKEQQWA